MALVAEYSAELVARQRSAGPFGIQYYAIRIVIPNTPDMIFVPAQAPLFQSIFGPAWDTLSPMMQRRYYVRPFSDDRVTVEGVLDVKLSPLAQLLSPFLKIVGALVPYAGSGIPVTVSFYSTPGRRDFHFDRTFHFPDRSYSFHSRMEPLTGGEMIEFMRFGLGWRFWYGVEGCKVVLRHRGYVWRVPWHIDPPADGMGAWPRLCRGGAYIRYQLPHAFRDNAPLAGVYVRLWRHV